jgi:hypothetical protein
MYNVIVAQEPRGPSLPTIIAFHPFRLLDLMLTQQFVTGMHDYGRFVVQSCTRPALSGDNSRDLTACCLPQQQTLIQILSERRK